MGERTSGEEAILYREKKPHHGAERESDRDLKDGSLFPYGRTLRPGQDTSDHPTEHGLAQPHDGCKECLSIMSYMPTC